MSRSIPENVSANQQNLEQCKKFLAGNRSCFYQGFWKNAPYKQEPKLDFKESEEKSKQGQS